MAIPLKAISGLSAIPVKISMALFHRNRKKILIFIWDHKRPQTAKAIFRKRTKLEVSHFLIPNYITTL